jgi:hypothetical protein
MQTKICPTCKIEKTLENYNKNKTRKDGFCRECRDCQSINGKKHYHTKKSPRLTEILKDEHKICSSCNLEFHFNMFNKQKGGRFGLSGECKTCLKERNLNWRENGGREWENHWVKNKKQTDPQFKLKTLLRGRLLDALKRHTKGGKVNKNHSAIILIGCTIDEYKIYLEKQFKPDMSWNNHGKVWEIDHILPCDSFDLTKEEEQHKCFNYKNTQPLYKSENRSKGNK